MPLCNSLAQICAIFSEDEEEDHKKHINTFNEIDPQNREKFLKSKSVCVYVFFFVNN